MQGATTGGVRILLRLEGLSLLLATTLAYSKLGLDWTTFGVFFLLPDLSFLGYFAGARIGALSYNAAHSYLGAMSCLVIAYTTSSPILLSAGLIWLAHIGFDRALGYGLKYAEGFTYTHLGRIGRDKEVQRKTE
jgi:hypothetical protein